MEHNEHKTVHVAEAKPLLSDLRALESSGELWRVLESSGDSPELHMLGWKNCGCAFHIYFRASY